MADSPAFQSVTPATLPAGVVVSTEEVSTLNGGAVTAQHVQRFLAAFRTSDGVAVDLPGDVVNGLDVDVTRLPAVVLDASTLAALETIQVGNFPATQPVSAASLPLPAGAASDAGLAAILVELGQKLEPADLATLATAAKQDTLLAKDFATQATLAAVLAKLSADPATQTTLAAILAAVDGLEVNTAGLASQATLASLLADSQAKADLAETQPVSAASLPLPAGAATGAKQDSAQTRLDLLASESKLEAVRVLLAGTLTAALDAGSLAALESITIGTALPAGSNNIGDVDVLTMPTVTTKHAGTTGAQTSVASTVTTNTTLIAADANRFGLIIYNDSSSDLFVLLGTGTESATVWTHKIAGGGMYEVPEAFVTMRASGHWTTATGSARITAAT